MSEIQAIAVNIFHIIANLLAIFQDFRLAGAVAQIMMVFHVIFSELTVILSEIGFTDVSVIKPRIRVPMITPIMLIELLSRGFVPTQVFPRLDDVQRVPSDPPVLDFPE